MILRSDPNFREKVLRFFNPTSIEDYHNSVLTEDVRHNCPDLYEIHIRPYLPEPNPEMDAMCRQLGQKMRERIDEEIWNMLTGGKLT